MERKAKPHSAFKAIGIVLLALLIVVAGVIIWFINYIDPWHKAVTAAGYEEKQHRLALFRLIMMIRGLNYYDPYFGAAFYDVGWNAGFKHEAALVKITCPTLLIHANFEVRGDGILNGAIDQIEADRIVELIENAEYMRVD